MIYICTYDHIVYLHEMIGGTMDNLIRIPVFVTEEHKEQLREIAHKDRTSVSEEVRKAVAEYLERKL